MDEELVFLYKAVLYIAKDAFNQRRGILIAEKSLRMNMNINSVSFSQNHKLHDLVFLAENPLLLKT